MFNFFNKNNKEDRSDKKPAATPEWLPLLQENKQRFFVFLDKLINKAEELTQAALPELQILKTEDERQHSLMLHGILGQLTNIRNKADEVYEEKIENIYQNLKHEVDVFHPYYKELNGFRDSCSDQMHQVFEEKINQFRDQLETTNFTDYEDLYQQILDEHQEIKNKFKCQQCGDTIPLNKIYFTISHIACPSCQNKNTFTPSSLAQGLEHIGRGLAEQRTQPLLDKYYEEQNRERALYMEAHELSLKQNFTAKNPEIEQQIKDLEQQRKASQALAPQLYEQYQRAMFDEWKRLVPDLAEHNERFYQSLKNRS